ncbi:MAG: site-2 protease family protein [Gemmataceae bacterium]
MQRTTTGSFWLFRAFDVDVHIHWSWFLIAVLQISTRPDSYKAPYWKAVEYVALFGFVLLHEFGHALACRSVGGTAHDIVLWPLGGIAFASPPPRPGALLWTIAAGPLVNLALIAPLAGVTLLTAPGGDLRTLFGTLTVMNAGLFVFNLLPVYPLDGGQILHALLWYGMGRWKSLQVVSLVGLTFGLAAFLLVLFLAAAAPRQAGGMVIMGFICLFVALVSANSFRFAKHAQHMQNLPRHTGCACPACHAAPPAGPFWSCDECQARFDTFDTRGKCPSCGAWFLRTACPHCRETHHIDRWFAYRPGVGLVERPAEAEEKAW